MATLVFVEGLDEIRPAPLTATLNVPVGEDSGVQISEDRPAEQVPIHGSAHRHDQEKQRDGKNNRQWDFKCQGHLYFLPRKNEK